MSGHATVMDAAKAAGYPHTPWGADLSAMSADRYRRGARLARCSGNPVDAAWQMGQARKCAADAAFARLAEHG